MTSAGLTTTANCLSPEKALYQASAVGHGDFSFPLSLHFEMTLLWRGSQMSNLFNWAQKNPALACGILGWVFTPEGTYHTSSDSFDKRVLDSSVYLVYLTVPMFSLISALGKKLILLRLML
jgi:hypothetical protein